MISNVDNNPSVSTVQTTDNYNFNTPQGLHWTGYILAVSDTGHQTVLYIDATGKSQFVANPIFAGGLGYDNISGTLFAVDLGRNVIWKGDSGGNTPLATDFLNLGGGIAYDGTTYLYVTDANFVKRVDLNGVIITIASGFKSPVGLAIYNNMLSVCDTGNSMIKTISLV